MVFRSSLAFGYVGCGLPWSQTQRIGVPGFWRSSGVRVWSNSVGEGLHPRGFPCSSAASVVVRMSSTEADESIKSVSVRISGKVQGVFYRNWTVDTAKQLGVNGWVRNSKDGSVEAVFSGKSAEVNAMIEKCKVGPVAAKVSSVEATPYKDSVPEGFERRPTVW